jgi:hypothetical protein
MFCDISDSQAISFLLAHVRGRGPVNLIVRTVHMTIKPFRWTVATSLVAVAFALLIEGTRAQSPAPRSMPMPGAAPGKSAVSIVSINPDTSLPLMVGERVKIKVVVAHTLDSESGTISIVVQAADNSRITQNFDVISRGTARTTLEAEFTVPATKAIQVFVPLHAHGQGPTSTLETRAYRVVAK